MRHAISFNDLAGRRVGVFGLGVEGRAARDRLVELDCELVIVDDDAVATGDHAAIETSNGGLEALAACDAVIKSPGISRYRDEVEELERRGIAVLGGVGMFLEEADRTRVICVTGTKGKSTVATVLGHLATGLGTPSVVTGNLGTPPFTSGLDVDNRLVIVETSSFQATDVAHSPGVVAVTALGEDHLDWHGSVARYHADKLSLSSQRGARCTVVADTTELRANEALLGGEVGWVSPSHTALATALGLKGRHGASNASVAVAALLAAGVDGSEDEPRLLAAASGFVGLPGRFREIARRDDLVFIDDSLATNPLPTIAALDAVGNGPLALLLGGHDRGVDYGELVEAIGARRGATLVVTLPDNGPKLGAQVARTSSVDVVDADDVTSAVSIAVAWLDGTGVVLLSPAAPSFSQFRNWQHRSEVFADAVAGVLG
jgi:UDP-N-acetylmuramoyl-L-alanine---L-glutamate ligase